MARAEPAGSSPDRDLLPRYSDVHELLLAPTLPPRAGTSSGRFTMAHSPHRSWRGCPLCKPQKRRGQGRAYRDPWRVVRQYGRKRRYRRGDTD